MRNKKYSALAFIGAVAINMMLTACGGATPAADGVPSAPPPSNPAPAAIEGVATPSSVAVVTATNAN